MNISNITPPQVWTSSSRSLTNIGSGALAPSNTIITTLAGASSVDLRSSAGIVGQMTIGILTGGAATAAMAVDIIDGVANIVLAQTAAAANSNAGFTTVTANTVGPRVRNADATNAGKYAVSAYVFTI